jgi:hypothetical protein
MMRRKMIARLCVECVCVSSVEIVKISKESEKAPRKSAVLVRPASAVRNVEVHYGAPVLLNDSIFR